LPWGQHTHLAIAEYWRWWVGHLGVEGFFEAFATVVIAFLFTRVGWLRMSTSTISVLALTIVFLFGGIIGTFHHLYFSGTPIGVLAFGATFSALEVVPLVLIGFEAYENLTLSRARPWVQTYKWPIYYFIAVAFWNLVGAGLFGFFINPPIALYYMQGLNTPPCTGTRRCSEFTACWAWDSCCSACGGSPVAACGKPGPSPSPSGRSISVWP